MEEILVRISRHMWCGLPSTDTQYYGRKQGIEMTQEMITDNINKQAEEDGKDFQVTE